MAVLCHSASSSLHSMMTNEAMLIDGQLMKDDPFYLDSSEWSRGGHRVRCHEDPVKTPYTTHLPRHSSVQQFYNTAPVFSSTQFHAAQMTLNNSKLSELDSDDVSLDSWQKTHPEQWTCEDVLNLIYFIALKSNDIEFASLHGEKFQNVAGAELCSMTEQDFVLRDSKYGKMLYQCIRTLLEKSQFLPPEDVVFVKEEKPDGMTGVHSEIPRPVEELSFEDSNDLFDEEKRSVINLFGINYDIDSAADFLNIQSTTDVIASSSSSSSVSSSVSPSSSFSSSSSGVCADTTCMDVDQKTEANLTYDDNYAYHMNFYPNYHNAHPHHHHQQQQQQQQQQSHQQRLDQERSLVPDSTVGRGGTPFPIDLRRSHKTDSAGGDLLWPQIEGQVKRKRNKSTSSDGEGSSGPCPGVYHDANRQSNNVGKNHLWEFLCQLLRISESVQAKDRVIQWESRDEGVFRIIDSKEVASLWGRHKGNDKMTYEKLSRALRWCRTFGFLAALPKDGKFPKKLCFRFGPRATNWRQFV